MSTLNTTNIKHAGNTGDANLVLAADGTSTFNNDVTVNGDVQMQSLNSGPLAGMRNQIINGDFRVWQRGTTGGGEYVADRWRMSGGVGNTYNRLVNDTDLAELGFSFGLTNAGPAATIFSQYIELTRNGRACQFPVDSQWTWSVWSTAVPTTTLINWSANDNATTEVAATPGAWEEIDTQGSWTRYQQTFTIANNPTDGGINSLLVRFNLANGQSVAGCQLEMGPVATPFEMRPIGTELALCQRYCNVIRSTAAGGPTAAEGYQHDPTSFLALFHHPVPLRSSPVNFSTQGGLGVVVSEGTTRPITALTLNNPNGFLTTQLKAVATSNASVGAGGTILMATGTGNAYIFDAEL